MITLVRLTLSGSLLHSIAMHAKNEEDPEPPRHNQVWSGEGHNEA